MPPNRRSRALPSIGLRLALSGQLGARATEFDLAFDIFRRSLRCDTCRRLRAVAMALVCLGWSVSGASAQLQTPDLTVKSRFGDWEIACRPPPRGAKNEICGMVQIVADESDFNVVINVQI